MGIKKNIGIQTRLFRLLKNGRWQIILIIFSGFLFSFITGWPLFLYPSFLESQAILKFNQQEETGLINKKIREIYQEVRPAALVSPEGLREWQSFLGQDEDDSYKDDHLFILILEKAEETIIWIQVTTFQAQDDRSIVKKAKESRLIKAILRGRETLIEKNDFSLAETELILDDIIRSIKSKKKILGIKL